MDPQAPRTENPAGGPMYQAPVPAPTYAGPGGAPGQPDIVKRGIAAFIDFAIIGAANAFMTLVLSIALGWIGAMVAAAVATALVLGRDIVIENRSLGKKLLGLAVVRADGSPITLQESIRRNATLAIGTAVGILGAVPLLGLLAIPLYLVAAAVGFYEIYLVASSKPRLGDNLAGGTRVVFQGQPAIAF
ncbi:RDD family protein [Longimicrobium sp.]|uniref:RDD family protein n=1 Tax=Longimicrobium sp. TaxID=2029185 RepID=UPI002CAFCA11|nr:RDD family protein [Longimicrobium sp.]HSU14248.1 RDD family protein [Longimicrobium sp.]